MSAAEKKKPRKIQFKNISFTHQYHTSKEVSSSGPKNAMKEDVLIQDKNILMNWAGLQGPPPIEGFEPDIAQNPGRSPG